MPRNTGKWSKDDRYTLVKTAASATVNILRQHGFSSAIFGGLACKLYGSARYPNDVDLLILDSSHSAEWFKTIVVASYPHLFYLKDSTNPQATYRILWYGQRGFGPQCKIDILVPGTLHLPLLSQSHISWISGFPLVPFSLLLLHKLQGWTDHRDALENFKRQKQHMDAADVRRLMQLDPVVGLSSSRPWEDEELFDEEFQRLSKERVKLYCEMFPDRAEEWELLGFQTS